MQNPSSPSYGNWDGPEPVSPIPAGQTSLRVVLAYDMGRPIGSSTVLWWFMAGRTNGVERDMCNEDQVQVMSAGNLDNIDPTKPPVPPQATNPRPFPADQFPEYGGCSWVASSGSGVGSVDCKDTGLFACAWDTAPYIQCNEKDMYGKMKIKPVVRCDFPPIGRSN